MLCEGGCYIPVCNVPRNLGNNEILIKLYFSSSVLLCYVTQILSYSSDYYFTLLFRKYINQLTEKHRARWRHSSDREFSVEFRW